MVTRMANLLLYMWIASSYCLIRFVAGQQQCERRVMPVFMPTETKLRADEDQSLTLPCVFSNMASDFYWYAGINNLFWNDGRMHNVSPQGNVKKYELDYSSNNTKRSANLTINMLSPSDSVTYECRAKYPNGRESCTVRAEFNVIVNYRPRVQFIEPREPPFWNYNDPGKIFVNETDNITLGCNSLSEPAPLINWIMIIPDGQDVELSPATEDTMHGNLTISNVSRTHSGIYRCQATNRLGHDTRDVELVVQYAPEVIGNQANIRAAPGTQVMLGCDVIAKPESIDFYWMKDGVRQTADIQDQSPNRFVIMKLNPEIDYGNYTCVATNEVGSASATIEVNGRPGAPVILNKDPQGSYRNSYNLSWSPGSNGQEIIPIARYIIKYQRKYIQNINGKRKTVLWPNEPLSETVHGGQLFIILRDLKENSSYAVRVCPESDYGAGDCVSYTFTTSLVDYQPPPSPAMVGYVGKCSNSGDCVGTWTPATGNADKHSTFGILTFTFGFISWFLS